MLSRRQRSKPSAVDREEAETIAVQGLGFLGGDPARLARFLALTGLEPVQLRREAQSAWFMAAVLDHLLSDESLLLVFCAETGVDPARVGPARRALSPRESEAY
jgi:hypothetical protein